MNIEEQVLAIKDKRISATNLVNSCLNKIEEFKNSNAFITVNKDTVLEEAKNWDEKLMASNLFSEAKLACIPFAIKDNINTKGMPVTAGTVALKNFYPDSESPIVSYLKQEGAVVIGKTNMHELAFGITGYNHAFYDTCIGVRNAFDASKFAGGSSSGSAVAVSSGAAIFSLGTDTGGSVRIPAALNGVVGFRPTIGRYPQEAVCPISHTRDTIGFMTQSVADTIYLDSLFTGDVSTESPNIIRLGYDESQCLANASDAVKKNWRQVLEKLHMLPNIELLEIELREIYELNSLISFPIALYETHGDLVDYLSKYNTGVDLESLVEQIASPDVKSIYSNFVVPKKLPTPDGTLVDAKPIYEQAINEYRPKFIDLYRKIFSTNKLDAIIAPTTFSEALDAVSNNSNLENFGLFIQNTDPTSNAGFPSISIPSGKTDSGLPLGLLLDGVASDDQRLLAIAKEIAETINH